MAELSPEQAARVAVEVYRVRSSGSVNELAPSDPMQSIGRVFASAGNSRLQGVSGALAWTEITGFGYVAPGLPGTEFAGDTLIALRGTDTLADTLTDARCGFQMGPSGTMVHEGFATTWNSIAPQLRRYFDGHRPRAVHCVGHSLGGALASLAADYVSSAVTSDVHLYTFGSPRPGGVAFANRFTQRVGVDRIRRVFHPADPVAMVPVFPFLHLPYGAGGYALTCDASQRITAGAHSSETSYLPGVTGKSWAQLRGNGQQTLTDRQIREWLGRAAQGGGILSFGARTAELIGIALDWILRQAAQVVLVGVQGVVTGGLTVLDQLAWLLERGAALSARVAGYVESLISVIFRFLGRTVRTGVSLTQQFIQWVLETMLSTLRAMVRAAIRAAR